MRSRLFLSFCLLFGIAGLVFFATSCGSSNNTQIRLLNAVVTQNDLTMLIDGNTAQSNVGYGTASSYSKVSSGSRHVQIEPSGQTSPIIDTTVSLGSGSATTALAYFDTSNNIQSAFLTDNNTAPSSGNFNIRIITAAPAMTGGADVYVVPTGTNISGVSPTLTAGTAGTLDNGQSSGYITLAAGDYDIYFVIPGTKTPWNGAQSTQISFSSGQIRTAVGLNSQTGGFQVTVLSDAG